jgi:hypothetical protein
LDGKTDTTLLRSRVSRYNNHLGIWSIRTSQPQDSNESSSLTSHSALARIARLRLPSHSGLAHSSPPRDMGEVRHRPSPSKRVAPSVSGASTRWLSGMSHIFGDSPLQMLFCRPDSFMVSRSLCQNSFNGTQEKQLTFSQFLKLYTLCGVMGEGCATHNV